MTLLVDLLPLIAILIVSSTSIGLLLSRDWHWDIALLALQYVGVSILTSASWPLEMSITKMVAGWMAGAVLGMATASVPASWKAEERFWPSGRLFRLLAALMVIIAALSMLPTLGKLFIQLSPLSLLGALVLVSLGLLHLGMTAQPLRISIGLLTILAGFEIIYAAVEVSTLVAGLLAGVNLGLGLIGAYMITASELEPEA